MEQLPNFIKKKKQIDRFYRKELRGIGDIKFQEVSSDVDANCWLFTFWSSKQDEILKALKNNDIVARPFWTPMNQLPMFNNKLYINQNDVSRNIHSGCLSIPSSVSLTEEQLSTVVTVIKSVF